jgi:hypothetical protein
MEKAGVGADARANERLANGGTGTFDDQAFYQKMVDLGSSPKEAATLTQIAAAQRLGRVGSTVRSAILNPTAKPDPYADDRVRLQVAQAQDDERMAMNDYKGLNLGALNGPTAEEYDNANDGDAKAVAKVTAWTRYLGARQKTREARRQGAASLARPAAPAESGPDDTSTVQPRGGKPLVADEPTDDEIQAAARALPDNATEADIIAWITTNRRR